MNGKRYFTPEELAQELARRGCVETGHRWQRGTIWLNSNGEEFSVPPPPDSAGYPANLVADILFFADPIRLKLGIKPT
jgi:hypothetical protein